jgi:hypothetical protein
MGYMKIPWLPKCFFSPQWNFRNSSSSYRRYYGTRTWLYKLFCLSIPLTAANSLKSLTKLNRFDYKAKLLVVIYISKHVLSFLLARLSRRTNLYFVRGGGGILSKPTTDTSFFIMRVKLDATEFEFIVEVIALHVSGVYAHRQEQ